MTDEMIFFLFLLERYANYKNKYTGDIFKEWNEKQITQEIYDSYWEYHQESLSNTYIDIDSLMTTGKHAW